MLNGTQMARSETCFLNVDGETPERTCGEEVKELDGRIKGNQCRFEIHAAFLPNSSSGLRAPAKEMCVSRRAVAWQI